MEKLNMRKVDELLEEFREDVELVDSSKDIDCDIDNCPRHADVYSTVDNMWLCRVCYNVCEISKEEEKIRSSLEKISRLEAILKKLDE